MWLDSYVKSNICHLSQKQLDGYNLEDYSLHYHACFAAVSYLLFVLFADLETGISGH